MTEISQDVSDYLPKQSKTVKAIFDHYKKVGDTESVRGYLGASIIGHPCERYLWYCFRQCCKPKFDGRMYRLFETGNLEEYRFIRNLHDIGCEVHGVLHDIGCEVHGVQPPPADYSEGHANSQIREAKQFEVKAINGHFSGHMDGCALRIPEAPKTWHVLEFKTHNAKSFNNLLRLGVQKTKPQHCAQMQAYMHLTGMTRALYLAVNKDTDDLYSERIHYDAERATQLMERAERIITATTPPERVGGRLDSCKWCDAQVICWGYKHEKDVLDIVPECPALPVPSLSCRQCCYVSPVMSGQQGGWTCEKHKRGLSSEDQAKPCKNHLVIPGLLPFVKEYNFGGTDEFGYECIEFTNYDNFSWRHGYAYGGYSSAELQKLPVSLLRNEMVLIAKGLFGATVMDCQEDILHRYPEGDSRIIWKGPKDELWAAWQKEYSGEWLPSLTPIAKCNVNSHIAVEFEGGRVAIMWKEKEQIGIQQAEIRQGVK